MDSEHTFYKVCREEEIQENEGKLVHAGTKKLALFLVEGQYYCIQNFCPHAGGFLALGPVEGFIVRCPRHAWGFDMRSGACKTNPRYEANCYPVKTQDGEIWIGLPNSTDPL